jgi:hypothetical protein
VHRLATPHAPALVPCVSPPRVVSTFARPCPAD